MKKTTLFLLTLCSLAAQAQIQAFGEATKNTFFGLGGYSCTKQIFPDGVQANPYVVSGPQNDFNFTASAVGGITNVANFITATSTNTTMTIQFQGNNIRKFGCNANAINAAATATTSNIVTVTATTNLNSTVSQNTVNGSRFAGFSVSGGANEYIVSIQIQFQSTPSPAARIAIEHIIFGDNTPQNVALNFDGVDDYVSTNATVGNFGTNFLFTVTCWIKPDATQPTSTINPDENDIISKWAGPGTGVNNNYPFVIRYLNETQTDPARRGKILVGQWDGTVFTTRVSTVAVNDGKWHHVAFVRQIDYFILYIDGDLQGTIILDNVSGSTNNTTPLQIGRRGNGQNYFRGEIDEVRIWDNSKDQITIQNEMFCKTPNTTNLQAAYNFTNGVPNDNNALITQVQDAVSTNHGTLNNFAKTGDASNFVTGQVKYVYSGAEGNYNGSSWLNGFYYLQSALTPNACNNLFDVYVATGFYKPDASNTAISFNIPSGMRIYGGFAGTEKSINQRNMALIRTTNETTLSGDLFSNDTPFSFTTNRTDNSQNVVTITGSNASLDGFTIRGAGESGIKVNSGITNALFKNNKVIDNNFGISVNGNNTTIANSIISGNKGYGVSNNNADALSINNSLIANNGFDGVNIIIFSGTKQTNISNSTISSNNDSGMDVDSEGTSNITLKNTLIYGNGFGGIIYDNNDVGTINNTITYSLVQGETSTANGNLVGTTNPHFVSPLAAGFGSLSLANLGDYRLKWCSLAINAGENTGISPLDLDRKPRNFNTTADMGAYEFLGNKPSQVNNSTITGTIDSPTYAGGAIQTITSTAKVIAPAGAIDFKAPNAIILNPGFEARGLGQYFKAQIGTNVGCVNN